ncbi:FAD synthetase [Fasciola gigantica]|uniref:FAD synthetase n=1 Tax=Fasciola gigantica TaxID=46835 RepID=A0A504Z478_FASGI|nr:FAD synthetase [Fasciola gigantica]
MTRCVWPVNLLHHSVRGWMHPRTLGLIVIGDEILNGKVEETNSRIVCKAASPLGLKLMKITAIPDDVNVIAREVHEFMNRFDVVITSGGIGPTHDDVTFEGIAQALDEETYTHPELLHVIETFFGFTSSETTPNDPRLRLARVPQSCELVYGIDCFTGRQSFYPVVKVHNVYALPGVPNLFRTGFGMIKEHLRDTRVKFYTRSVYVTRNETEIAGFLSALADKYSPDVSIGSYPAFHNSYYRVLVTLDSQNEGVLEEAHKEALAHLGSDIIDYEPNPVRRSAECVYELATKPTDLGRRVLEAIQTIEKALDQYTLDQIVIGFNGGKDCTAHSSFSHAVSSEAQSGCTKLRSGREQGLSIGMQQTVGISCARI